MKYLKALKIINSILITISFIITIFTLFNFENYQLILNFVMLSIIFNLNVNILEIKEKIK